MPAAIRLRRDAIDAVFALIHTHRIYIMIEFARRGRVEHDKFFKEEEDDAYTFTGWTFYAASSVEALCM